MVRDESDVQPPGGQVSGQSADTHELGGTLAQRVNDDLVLSESPHHPGQVVPRVLRQVVRVGQQDVDISRGVRSSPVTMALYSSECVEGGKKTKIFGGYMGMGKNKFGRR